MREHRIEGHGGTRLFVADAGPEDAPPLVLIHGWSQCHLSWAKQLSGLSDRFRVVAPDLRGHGLSDKPRDPAAYDNGTPWAGDIAAIVAALSLRRPILVGWSMGGWTVCDYLRAHGDAALSGIALVGSTVQTGALTPPEVAALRGADVVAEPMYGDDLAANLKATVAFVRACFAAEPSAQDLATITGFNMLCPPDIRAWARKRAEDYSDTLARLSVPALIAWGEGERVMPRPAFDIARAALPHARVATYPRSGHSPFWEEPESFNDDLAAFARDIAKVAA